ncbi:CLUMA_CG008323, isoform A [Clunio marinus]|uniref:CLUMA_CG008323, isoform A n=1 Tax=Clunio marinus TaxID=568069 RepID=A0A1J1I3F8_9DIPT|nr:CLUMA_CG008323, isoform A [Clunio marinus]
MSVNNNSIPFFVILLTKDAPCTYNGKIYQHEDFVYSSAFDGIGCSDYHCINGNVQLYVTEDCEGAFTDEYDDCEPIFTEGVIPNMIVHITIVNVLHSDEVTNK